jgi:hypothetical protein
MQQVRVKNENVNGARLLPDILHVDELKFLRFKVDV